MNRSKCSFINTASILMLCLLILAGCGEKKHDPKTTAAVINGHPISREVFDKEMERIKQRFINKAPSSDEQLDNIRNEVLEILIGGELLYQASLDKGISVKNDEVASELEKIKEQFPDTETFTNTFTDEDIKRKISIERFIIKEFADTTVISDEESKKYYNSNIDDFTTPEQVMARHILLKSDPGDTAESREKVLAEVTQIKAKITQGEDFAELAKQHSQDSSAANGGALGYFMRGQMVEPFEKAAFSLAKDEVSDIVKTDFGYHLIKVLDKKPMTVVAYDEIVDKLKAYLKQQKVQKKVDSFIKDQRAKAQVEILSPEPA